MSTETETVAETVAAAAETAAVAAFVLETPEETISRAKKLVKFSTIGYLDANGEMTTALTLADLLGASGSGGGSVPPEVPAAVVEVAAEIPVAAVVPEVATAAAVPEVPEVVVPVVETTVPVVESTPTETPTTE